MNKTRKNKELTIIIPAYNVERYLHKCMRSMVAVDERLEIIIVDDGSTDRTAEISDEYAQKYPEEVRVIHKTNGGHGSGINTGVKSARGRYFKVIDADDWIITKNLKAVLDQLEQSDVDVVLAGFHAIDMSSGKKVAYSSICEYVGRKVNVEKLLEIYNIIPDCFSFHGLFYRTAWYCAAGIHLTEGVFYEDQEYAIYPMAHMKSILVLPEYFYQYMVGNSSQSVSYQNQVKRIGDIEAVLKDMVAYYWEHTPMKEEREEYYIRRLSIAVISYFAVALVKNKNRKQGKMDAERMYSWLEREMPELLYRTKQKYCMLRLARMVHFPPGLYQQMFTAKIYPRFRRLWIK